MTQFEGLKWIAGLTLYYIFVFLIMITMINAKASVIGTGDQGLSYTDPGFQQPNIKFYNNGYCAEGTSLNYHWIANTIPGVFYLGCNQFKDYDTCNSFKNCNWTNETMFFFFNNDHCGCIETNTDTDNCNVNLDYYGFTPVGEGNFYDPENPMNKYYTMPNTEQGEYFCSGIFGLSNAPTCTQFGCTWIANATRLSETQSAVTWTNVWGKLYHSFAWIITFQADLGLGAFNWIFIMIFIYFPLLAVIGSLYFLLR